MVGITRNKIFFLDIFSNYFLIIFHSPTITYIKLLYLPHLSLFYILNYFNIF